jgi:hypothetical protein
LLVLGGPIVHAVHGNFARGGISLGMRVGGPVLGALIGLSVDEKRYGWLSVGLFLGGIVGSLAISAVDIALLAYDKDEDPTAARVLSIGGRF